MVLRYPAEGTWISNTRLSLSLATYSKVFFYSHPIPYAGPYNTLAGLGCSAFARRYWRNLNCIFFPHPTEMFQFRWCPVILLFQPCGWLYNILSLAGWIAPFGNRRIAGLWLLPDDYRGHIRPSSARTPKAFIIGFIALRGTKSSPAI